MNPGGSVKDRAARGIIDDAEQRGELQPGGIVVEGTAGNTGIGLAHVCNARGYRCVIVMPDNQSAEKYKLLEMLGAEVHKVPTVPYSNPNQYQKVAGRLAESLPNAIWSNQFDNTANRDAHFSTTGPEIWAQTERSHRRVRRRERHRRHVRGRLRVPEVEEPEGALRARGSAGQQPLRVREERRAEGHRQRLHHRRHRHRSRHREHRHARRSTTPCTSRIRRR